jgi:O-antigen ligase
VTARGIAIAIFAATPLGLLTGAFLSHDVMPKVVLLLGGAACLLMLTPQWTAKLRGGWFAWMAVAQASVLVLSTLFSTQPLLSFTGSTWRRFGTVEQLAVLVIACCVAATAGGSRWLWRAVSGCAGIASLYGIAQYFGFDPFLERRLYAVDYLGGIVRPPATMGHAIYYSAYLVPVALIAAWQTGEEKSRGWRMVHVGVAALAPLAILLSGSRGALLGLISGGALLMLSKGPSKKVLAISAAGILAVAAIVAFAPAGADVRHRIAQWREDPGSVRIALWRESPALIARAPLLGSGPETFAGAFRLVESAGLARAYPDFINETPHNAFIDAACEEGLLGASILLAIFALGLGAKQSPGLRAAMLGMLVCGLFASFSLVSSMYLWAIAGTAALGNTSPRTVPARAGGAWRIFAILAAVVFLSAAILLGVQDASYAELDDAVQAKDLPAAQRAVAKATSFGVGLPGYELWGSQQMAKLKAWDEARNAATLAGRRGEDRAGALYQSSILEIVSGNATAAEGKANEAILIAPNWYKPHLLKAQILKATGRNEEAAREGRISLNLGWKGK